MTGGPPEIDLSAFALMAVAAADSMGGFTSPCAQDACAVTAPGTVTATFQLARDVARSPLNALEGYPTMTTARELIGAWRLVSWSYIYEDGRPDEREIMARLGWYCGGGSDSWKFYVNGVKVEGVAATIISDLDRVLLSYGSETDAQVLADQVSKVTDQACIPSERCKDRIKPDEPIEMCTASNDAGCVKPGG